jgi:predicted permease
MQRDVDQEIEFHLATRIDALVRAGATPVDARATALREFGDVSAARADLNRIDQRRFKREQRAGWWDSLRQDTRYAARSLRREPLLATAVVLTLALGVGANASMFSIVDRLVLSAPAHVHDAGAVVKVYLRDRDAGRELETTDAFSYPMYAALRDQVGEFSGLAAAGFREVSSGEGRDAVKLRARVITPNYFTTLGVRPAMGRFFTDAEAAIPVGDPVVVLGHDFWRARFGADSAVIGRTLLAANTSFTIIGVAPRGLAAMDLLPVDAWFPISAPGIDPSFPQRAQSFNSTWLRLYGRLREAHTHARAEAAVLAASLRVVRENAIQQNIIATPVLPVSGARRFDGARAPEARVAMWLLGVSAVVLAIACANVINLLLARANRRRREIGVRVALGVGRGRLAQLFAVEAFLLAAAGGAAALITAYTANVVLRRTLLAHIAWDAPVTARIVAITVVIALGVWLAIAVATALVVRLTEVSGVADTLRTGRGGGIRRGRLQRALLVLQPALSVLLLIGAGLFTRSLARVRALDLGLETHRVVIATVDLTGTAYGADDQQVLLDRAVTAVGRVPGVETVAVAATVPFDSNEGAGVTIPERGDTLVRLGGRVPRYNAISPTFFRTTGTGFVRGREFSDTDEQAGAPRVAIVNETLAKTAWGAVSPLGRCLRFAGQRECMTVIGVVRDARQSTLFEPPLMQFYVPLSQRPLPSRAIFVRTARAPDRVLASIRTAVQSIAPDLPFANVYAMQSRVDLQVRPWSIATMLFGIFGGMALLVAAVGVYSVLAYSVTQRTHEIGLRLALGAPARSVLALIVGSGMRVALVGVVIGAALAIALSRFVAPLLFNTSPRDPLVFAVVTGTMLLTAVIASAAPAIRAARINPISSLRQN